MLTTQSILTSLRTHRCSQCQCEFRDQNQLNKHTKEGCPGGGADTKKGRVHIIRDEGKYNSAVASKPGHRIRNFTINNNIDNNLRVLCIHPSAELVDCTLSPPMWPSQFTSLLMVDSIDIDSLKLAPECRLLERIQARIHNPKHPLRFDFKDQRDFTDLKDENQKSKKQPFLIQLSDHLVDIDQSDQLANHLKWNRTQLRKLNQLITLTPPPIWEFRS
jgi:hypothetical protein